MNSMECQRRLSGGQGAVVREAYRLVNHFYFLSQNFLPTNFTKNILTHVFFPIDFFQNGRNLTHQIIFLYLFIFTTNTFCSYLYISILYGFSNSCATLNFFLRRPMHDDIVIVNRILTMVNISSHSRDIMIVNDIDHSLYMLCICDRLTL